MNAPGVPRLRVLVYRFSAGVLSALYTVISGLVGFIVEVANHGSGDPSVLSTLLCWSGPLAGFISLVLSCAISTPGIKGLLIMLFGHRRLGIFCELGD